MNFILKKQNINVDIDIIIIITEKFFFGAEIAFRVSLT